VQLGAVPGERLELEPDLLVGSVIAQVAHGRAPFLDERDVCRVHRALALSQPVGEPLQYVHEDVLHRAEVVVDEPVVEPRLAGEAARRDPGVTLLHQKPLGGIE
jgi:hypothetical protein